MKKIITLLFLAVLYSCDQYNSNEKFEKKTVENKYSLSVPESLGATTELNDEASLQLQNQFDEFYVIVIDELKTDFVDAIENNLLNTTPDLDGYYNATLNNFKKSGLKDFKFYDVKKKKINSSSAIVFSVSGISDGFNVFYRFAIVQGKERYYQIMSWTEASKEKKYNERMNRILDSFNVEEAGYSKSSNRLAKKRKK